MGQYLPVLVMLVLGAGFAGSSLVMSKAVSPKRPSAAKAAPYECGIVPGQQPPERFPVRFYLVAMIFIVFDIEIIFLYPYAVIHRELGVFGLVEMVVFAIAVFASFLYLIANGALDWGPVQSVRRLATGGVVSVARTAATTVRRVGADGREPRSTDHGAAA
ncbi:MAG: NADH-quinone oxidoreductase subunit A [Acidimicrobiales bacterium]|jgi:NADH-quinone oxidoreductase subunit A|nr:NADH-quinone oxidoreductase subunit A [Acidimicrobiales bacterium]